MVSKCPGVTSEDTDNEKLVLNYLKSQYRPYAINDLILNLHNKVSKPIMIKNLNNLVLQQQVISKNIGKSAYFVHKERDLTELEGVTQEITSYKHRCTLIETLEAKVMAIESDVRNLESELKSRQAVPLAELLEQVATMLEKELAELNGSYDSMESAARSQKSVDIPEGEDAESIMAHRNVLNHILGLRKNMFNRFVALINEAINFSLVAPNMGIDLDELNDYNSL